MVTHVDEEVTGGKDHRKGRPGATSLGPWGRKGVKPVHSVKTH